MSLRRYIFRKYISMSTTSNLAFYHENAARKVYPHVILLFRNTSCFDKKNWIACGATVEVAVCGRGGLRKQCDRKILRFKKCSPRVPDTLLISFLWFAFWTKENISKWRLQRTVWRSKLLCNDLCVLPACRFLYGLCFCFLFLFLHFHFFVFFCFCSGLYQF